MSRPLTAEQVGAHLVECIRRPRPMAYSTRGQALAMHLSDLAPVRLALMTEMARSMRGRLGIATWSDVQPPLVASRSKD